MSNKKRNRIRFQNIFIALCSVALLSGCAAISMSPGGCPNCGRNAHVPVANHPGQNDKVLAQQSRFHPVPTRPVFEPVSALLLNFPKTTNSVGPQLERVPTKQKNETNNGNEGIFQPNKSNNRDEVNDSDGNTDESEKPSVALNKSDTSNADKASIKEDTQVEIEEIDIEALSKLPVLNAPETKETSIKPRTKSNIKLSSKPKKKTAWQSKRKSVRK